jgi:hypothetical protein
MNRRRATLTAATLARDREAPDTGGFFPWRPTAPTPPRTAASDRYTSVPHAAGT